MGANEKPAATFHGIGEEFECPACGDVFLSPLSAAMCEARDEAETRATWHAMTRPAHRDNGIIRSTN